MVDTAVVRQQAKRAWWAVVVLFLAHGLVVSSWLSRIPQVQTSLGLSNGVLGMALLCPAIGAVLTIPYTGYLVSRFGSSRMSFLASVGFCCVVILPGLAFNAISLGVALFFYGVLAAGMDVSMNAQGVEVENALGEPTMSRFHALFSTGAMLGAAVGGAVASKGIPPLVHFAGATIVNLALVFACRPFLMEDRIAAGSMAGEHPHRLPFRKIPRALLALSAIAFLCLLSEGAIADWTAVYMGQVLNAGPAVAAAGYSAFSASMALFRFLGDAITLRLGPLATVRWGCYVAACGLIAALLPSTPSWSFPGWLLAGVGLSVVIPLAFGGGGRVKGISPGAGIATVTGLGYVGFIVGPPSIGFASELFTLRYGLGLVVLCCVLAGSLAGFMRELRGEST